MAAGGPEGFAAPPNVSPELEHWFAQIAAEMQNITEDPPTFSGLTLTGTDGIDFTPGSDVDVDLLTVEVTDDPTLSWDESLDVFALSKGLLSSNGLYFDPTSTSRHSITRSGASLLFRAGSSSVKFSMTANQVAITGSGTSGGLSFSPGGDLDVDLLRVSVNGTPKLTWDESEDRMAFTHGIHIGVPGTSGGSVRFSSGEMQLFDSDDNECIVVGQNGNANAALGFYGASSVTQQTGVAVSAAGIHAALVNLGLITA